jgi:hypothetical protein
MKMTSSYKKVRKSRLVSPACVIAVAILLFWACSDSIASGITQRTFSSAEKAVKSLVAAVRADDEKEMIAILGPGSLELISSGDEAADRTGREKFARAYDQMNKIEQISEDIAIVHIGTDDWTLPIPLAKMADLWFFDTDKGKNEMLNRRIGRNELHVIDVLDAYVDAQHEYATRDCRGEGKVEFAQRLISSEGKRDGLYWEAGQGEEESPLGPLVAKAAREGYANPYLQPFHGYFFRILKSQGKHANGGAYSYIVNDKMILGFAIIAYPAEYGNSGVMTFIVNQDGIVYQKNLGKKTKRIAETMKTFDPDGTWKKVSEE